MSIEDGFVVLEAKEVLAPDISESIRRLRNPNVMAGQEFCLDYQEVDIKAVCNEAENWNLLAAHFEEQLKARGIDCGGSAVNCFARALDELDKITNGNKLLMQALAHAAYRTHEPEPESCDGCREVSELLGENL